MQSSKKNKKKIIIAVSIGAVVSLVLVSAFKGYNTKIKQQDDLINSLKTNKNPVQMLNDITSSKAIKIAVAKADIQAGTQLSMDNMELKDFKIEEVPDGHIKDLNSIVGFTVNNNITAGTPLTSALFKELQVRTINIPNGMRAVTVPMEYVQGFASYINIGSRLDIVSASKEEKGKVIVQNVKVISFESGTGVPTADGKTQSKTLTGITIEVPANDAPKLVDAMVSGKLQLLTRNFNDTAKVSVNYSKPRAASRPVNIPPPPVTTTLLPPIDSLNKRLPDPAMPPARPTKPPKKVEMIQANVKSEVTFDD